MPAFFRRPFENFLLSRSGPFEGQVELDRSRVYILPTRIGMIFTLLLLFLLLGSINYGKSLGFILTFLLAALGNIAMLTTWRNLAGLRIKNGGCSPVFSGQEAVFAVQMQNPDAQERYSIAVSYDGKEYDVGDCPASGVSLIRFRQVTQQRGQFKPGRFRLSTEYPLGLFVAWTVVDLSMQCIVYPKPAERASPPLSRTNEDGDYDSRAVGLEDYSGLRKFQPGDSWRRVSWKAAAKSDELYIKEFTGGRPQSQWIDWELIEETDTEKRLSIMTRLVIDAEESGRLYGLRLPGINIVQDRGNLHRHRCLSALAMFGIRDHDNGQQ